MTGRHEARARLSTDDQRRVTAAAREFGVSGLGLTVWLLAQELDGLAVEDALQMVRLAHRCRQQPGWDPTVRQSEDVGPYTLCLVPPHVWDQAPMTLPPVPGIGTATVIMCDRPAVNPARHVIDIGTPDPEG